VEAAVSDLRPPAAVRVDDVTLTFGAVRALDRVSFQVPEGSVTGLIGRNGAGKSTTIRILAGLLEPSEPASGVRVLGLTPVRERERLVVRAGFLLSEPALFSYLTANETLRFLARAYGLETSEGERRARDLIAFFELAEAADRFVDDYSTGMRKRLALAAALIHAPELLVLDEPFESLDPLMVRSLKKLLLAFGSRGGTVLLSSHLIDAVEEICDRIVILEQGRVVSAGTTGEAKAAVADHLPSATLEDLYASLLPESSAPELDWLTGRQAPWLRARSVRRVGSGEPSGGTAAATDPPDRP
jgi:ABC-2 type transport system ATP-binding protein